MKKFLKIAASIVVVLLAALLIIPLTLKGKIGDIVKMEANKMLSAHLDFEELDISLLRHFPNASIDLNGLQLTSGVAPFEGDTIVAADRISVVVNLLSLFGDEGFEVRRILLNKPYIHGQKSAQGEVNWDVMKPSEEAEAEIEEVETEEAEEEAAPSSFRLALRDVTISEATLRYEDDSTQMRAAISPLNLDLKGDFSALKSGLKLETVASNILFENEGVRLANGLEIELRADLDADLENKRFTLSDNLFRINAIRMMLSGEVALPDEGVEVDLELKSDKVEFREILSLIPLFYLQNFDELKASGELALSATAKGILSGDRMPAFDLKLGVKNGSFKYASLPQSVTGIRLAAEVKNPGGTLDATLLNLSDFGMTMAGHSLSARLSAASPFSDLQFNFGADGKIDLGAIKEVYPLGDSISLKGLLTLDVDAAGRLSDIEAQRFEEMQASGNITLEQMQATVGTLPEIEIERIAATISPKALTLGESQIRIGESDLQANGQLSNYMAWALRDETLKGRLYLKSNLLDINELLGAMPTSEEAQEEPQEEEESQEESAPLTAPEVPQNLDLSLETSFKRILFQRMTITDFTGNLAVKGGRVDMSKLAMQALGGSLTASASYSTAEEATAPRLKMKAEVRNASFSRTFDELDMVRKMVPLFEKTGGNYSLSLDLSTRMLQDLSIDYPSLNATGELRSGNIELGNVPIYSALSTALGNGKLPASTARDLVVKFAITNGRLSTEPFDLKLGSTTLNLSGSTGLDQTIDYTARVSLPGKAGSVVQNLNVKIQGTFAKPKISVDVAEAAREAATNLANSAIQQLTGSATVSEEIARQAERLRQEAVAAGERLVQAAEQQRQQLIDKASGTIAKLAATKAGDLLVQEAERQAANLVAEAERQIAKLQGGEAN
uniref:AsmA family protein n=1 Tax=Alistipes sp. TaxID=1872444 RepID=UPI00405749E8